MVAHVGMLYVSGLIGLGSWRQVLINADVSAPVTGWPVANAPRSITVAAPTCSQAGSYSTLAMLQVFERWATEGWAMATAHTDP